MESKLFDSMPRYDPNKIGWKEWKSIFMNFVQMNDLEQELKGSSQTVNVSLTAAPIATTTTSITTKPTKASLKLKHILMCSINFETISLLGLDTDIATAQEIWSALVAFKERKSTTARQTSKAEFLSMKQDNLSIAQWISKINNQTIKMKQQDLKVDDEDKVFVLTAGLRSEFVPFADNFTLLINPSFMDLCEKLISYEEELNRRKKSNDSFNKNDIVNYAPNKNSMNKNQSKDSTNVSSCVFCKRKGHVMQDCMFKNKQCFNCKSSDHRVADCPHPNKMKSRNKDRNNSSSVYKNENEKQKNDRKLNEQDKSNETNYAGLVFSSNEVDDVNRIPNSNESSFAGSVTIEQSQNMKSEWISDSGATCHITNCESNLYDVEFVNQNVKLANGAKAEVVKIGKVDFKFGTKRLVLHNVKYSPSFTLNLMSVGQLSSHGIFTLFRDVDAIMSYKKDFICKLRKDSNGLFYINNHCEFVNAVAEDFEVVHSKLGHPGQSIVKSIISQKAIENFPQTDCQQLNCESCITGKQNRVAFRSHSSRDKVSKPLYRIHLDVCQVTSNLYYSLIVDEYSRLPFIQMMSSKAETTDHIINWIKEFQNKLNLKVIEIYSDGGSEYKTERLKQFVIANGTHHLFTIPNSPQNNGISERTNQSLFKIARCVLHSSKLNFNFIKHALLFANYTIQFRLSIANKTKTTYELFYNRKPNYRNLHVFGSDCWIYNFPKDKVSAQYRKGIFLGFSTNSINGLTVLDLDFNRTIESRDVIVKQNEFHFGSRLSNLNELDEQLLRYHSSSQEDQRDLHDNLLNQQEQDVDLEHYYENLSNESDLTHDDQSIESRSDQDELYQPEFNDSDSENHVDMTQPQQSQIVNGNSNDVPLLRVNKRAYRKAEIDLSNITTSRRNRIRPEPFNLTERDVYDEDISNLNSNNQSNYAMACTSNEKLKTPECYNDVMQSKEKVLWEKSMDDEVESLKLNKTYDVVEDKSEYENKNVIDTKWVWKIKTNTNNDSVIFKSRICARGFKQREFEDYNEIFSPTLKFKNLKLILAISNSLSYCVVNLDIKTAFLNAAIDSVVYLKLPKGFRQDSEKTVRLNKSLYGLKQSPRLWYKLFSNYLIDELQLKSIVSDECIFVKTSETNKTIIALLYVDDIVLCYSPEDQQEALAIQSKILKRFPGKNLGPVTQILGIQVKRDSKSKEMILSQSESIEKLIEDFEMENAKDALIPSNSKLEKVQITPHEMKDKPIRKLVGCLSWIAVISRPDLSYSVNQLAKHVNNFNQSHWTYGLNIVKYLKGTKNQNLILKHVNNDSNVINLECFSDASFNDENHNASSFGYVLRVNGQTVHWSASTIRTTCLSTCESEFISISKACAEIIYATTLLKEVFASCQLNIEVKTDNQAAKFLALNGSFQQRTKHINIRYFYIKQLIEQKLIKLDYVKSQDQLADIFTKSLPIKTINYFKTKLNIM